MKKLFIVASSSFIFLLFTSLVLIFLNIFEFKNYWISLIIGCGIIIFSIVLLILYLKLKVQFILYLIFFINIIAMGFLIKIWHMYKGYNLDLSVFLLISLACIGYLLIFYLLSFIPLFSKHFKIFVVVYIILSIIGYVILIDLTKTDYLSTYGYYMIIEIGFIFALSIYSNNIKDLIKSICVSTFMIIIVAIIMIIIMLDGDFDLDFIDGDLDFMSPKDQIKRNSQFQ